MRPSILLLLVQSVAVISTATSPLLVPRQLVPVPCPEQGKKACGNQGGCIDLTATCCPSGAGGCPLGTYCDLASNGEYGCCPLGEVCTGDGGAITSGGIITSITTITDAFTSTQTTVVPDETSTLVEETTPVDTPSATDDQTSASTALSTLTSTSTTAFTSSSAASAPVLSSSTSSRVSNVTTGRPTVTSSLPEFTGAADSQARGVSSWILAILLPLFAL